jgi:hypothetical protein
MSGGASGNGPTVPALAERGTKVIVADAEEVTLTPVAVQ